MLTYGQKMKEEGRREGLLESEAREARARAQYVLRILASRSIPVDRAARQRILRCRNPTTLDCWFDRALRASSLSEVLDEPATRQ